jgi:hypothetical protein
MNEEEIGKLYQPMARDIIRRLHPEITMTDLEFEICSLLHRSSDDMSRAKAITELAQRCEVYARQSCEDKVEEICRFIKHDLAKEAVAHAVYRKFTGREP